MDAQANTALVLNLVTDLEFIILSSNLQVNGLAGTSESLRGKCLTKVLPFFDAGAVAQTRLHCMQQPDHTFNIQMCMGENGHSRNISWLVSPQLNANGKPESLQWTGMELPQQKKADESTAFQQALMAISADAIVLLNTSFEVVDMNAVAENIYGLSAATAKGQRLHQLLSFVLQQGTDADVSRMLQEEGEWQGSFQFINAQGQLRFCKSHIRKIVHQNKLAGFIAVDEDLTSSLTNNTSCEVNDELYAILEAINNQSGTLVWAADAEGRLRYYNASFAKIYGLTEGDLNKAPNQLFNAETAAYFLRQALDTINSDKTELSFEKGRLPNGNQGTYRTLKFPIKTVYGTYAASIALDVTRIVEKEAEMSLLKTRYEQAALIIADVISDWDIVADRFWRSDPTKGMLVHHKKAASIKDRYNRVHPDDLPHFKNSLYTALQSDAVNWECQYRYQQGKIENEYKILHEKAIILRNENGLAVRMISVLEDVTEQEKLRHALLEKERQIIAATIEGQEAERNELACELHDNIGQVLAMCKLFVDIAADAVPHEYLDKSRDHLQKAIREIRSLSHRLSPETLDRKGLPEAIADLVANINQTGKLHMQLDMAPDLLSTDLPQPVQTTAYRIVQEKISNILKHAEASAADIKLCMQDGKLRILICDNGKGFDPASVKAGIGLKNIYNRVELIGGKADLQSSPGAGCRLRVDLPLSS